MQFVAFVNVFWRAIGCCTVHVRLRLIRQACQSLKINMSICFVGWGPISRWEHQGFTLAGQMCQVAAASQPCCSRRRSAMCKVLTLHGLLTHHAAHACARYRCRTAVHTASTLEVPQRHIRSWSLGWVQRQTLHRSLNANTVTDSWPLPCIDEMLAILKGAKYFSKLDLHDGYH